MHMYTHILTETHTHTHTRRTPNNPPMGHYSAVRLDLGERGSNALGSPDPWSWVPLRSGLRQRGTSLTEHCHARHTHVYHRKSPFKWMKVHILMHTHTHTHTHMRTHTQALTHTHAHTLTHTHFLSSAPEISFRGKVIHGTLRTFSLSIALSHSLALSLFLWLSLSLPLSPRLCAALVPSTNNISECPPQCLWITEGTHHALHVTLIEGPEIERGSQTQRQNNKLSQCAL